MVILPLIPLLILLIQNATTFTSNDRNISELRDVNRQILNAVDLATLARKLQEERIAVALHFFIKRRGNLSSVSDLADITELNINEEFLIQFRMADTFNATDQGGY